MGNVGTCVYSFWSTFQFFYRSFAVYSGCNQWAADDLLSLIPCDTHANAHTIQSHFQVYTREDAVLWDTPGPKTVCISVISLRSWESVGKAASYPGTATSHRHAFDLAEYRCSYLLIGVARFTGVIKWLNITFRSMGVVAPWKETGSGKSIDSGLGWELRRVKSASDCSWVAVKVKFFSVLFVFVCSVEQCWMKNYLLNDKVVSSWELGRKIFFNRILGGRITWNGNRPRVKFGFARADNSEATVSFMTWELRDENGERNKCGRMCKDSIRRRAMLLHRW